MGLIVQQSLVNSPQTEALLKQATYHSRKVSPGKTETPWVKLVGVLAHIPAILEQPPFWKESAEGILLVISFLLLSLLVRSREGRDYSKERAV